MKESIGIIDLLNTFSVREICRKFLDKISKKLFQCSFTRLHQNNSNSIQIAPSWSYFSSILINITTSTSNWWKLYCKMLTNFSKLEDLLPQWQLLLNSLSTTWFGITNKSNSQTKIKRATNLRKSTSKWENYKNNNSCRRIKIMIISWQTWFKIKLINKCHWIWIDMIWRKNWINSLKIFNIQNQDNSLNFPIHIYSMMN